MRDTAPLHYPKGRCSLHFSSIGHYLNVKKTMTAMTNQQSLVHKITTWIVVLATLTVQSAYADEIIIAIGHSLPPYVIGSTDSGLEVDIIRESFELSGHSVSFRYSPSLNIAGLMASNRIDGVAANTAYDVEKSIKKQLFESDPTISFQNFAVTLKHFDGKIQSIKALQEFRIIAFLNAKIFLGKHYANMAAANKGYTEHANQMVQPKMLIANRVDVAIADKRIFKYWAQKSNIDSELNFKFHRIFQPSPRRVTFHERSYRDDLNQGLAELHKSGRYKALIKKYGGL